MAAVQYPGRLYHTFTQRISNAYSGTAAILKAEPHRITNLGT
jgi:hypothetical protein